MLNENFPVCGKTLFARWQSRFGFEDKSSPSARAISPRLARPCVSQPD
jgi:hypothetical protein